MSCSLRERSVLTKPEKRKQWESIVIYEPHYLFFNDHPKDIWLNLFLRRLHSDTNLNSYSQTLTLLFITFTTYPSNAPILLCWHQLRSLWATLQYQCDHFLQPQKAECPHKTKKEKQWESIVIYKPHFLFFDDHLEDIRLNLLLRRLHSDTNLNEIFKLVPSDSDFTLYNIYNLSF